MLRFRGICQHLVPVAAPRMMPVCHLLRFVPCPPVSFGRDLVAGRVLFAAAAAVVVVVVVVALMVLDYPPIRA